MGFSCSTVTVLAMALPGSSTQTESQTSLPNIQDIFGAEPQPSPISSPATLGGRKKEEKEEKKRGRRRRRRSKNTLAFQRPVSTFVVDSPSFLLYQWR